MEINYILNVFFKYQRVYFHMSAFYIIFRGKINITNSPFIRKNSKIKAEIKKKSSDLKGSE